MFVTPVVAFYLLRDWDQMVARIDSCLPRQHAATLREQAALIDTPLAGWVRGQSTAVVGESCRDGVGQEVWTSGGAVSLKKIKKARTSGGQNTDTANIKHIS